ncbi:hypothetical protein [Glaciimonas sp. PCH181]|nr:hypothetical protein [Glaciimonas sp. PCH181]
MASTNFPLENLAAFAIVVVVSVFSTVCLGAYITKIKKNGKYAA